MIASAATYEVSGQTAGTGCPFGVLGPLRVCHAGGPVDLGPRKQQIVLAVLLCNANSPVSVDLLTEALWDDEPPRTARKNIQVYVSALRPLVAVGDQGRISYVPGGYVLRAAPQELDALGFARRVRDSRRRGDAAAVAGALDEALELWRGPAFAGLRDVQVIDTAACRLELQFLSAFEDWAEAGLATGNAARVAERVTGLVESHPLRERLRLLQMSALCQAGRRSEALAAYDEVRRQLARELGLSPGPALTALQRKIFADQRPGPLPVPVSAYGAQGRACSLPRDVTAFTGHEAEAAALRAAVAGNGGQLAVVTGPPGAGKTALAVRVAHQAGEGFPDGRYFARLRDDDGTPRPVAAVAAGLLRAAGAAPAPGQEPAAAWRQWLTARRALVILDDARTTADVAPYLPETGNAAFIVTARPALTGLSATARVAVPPLAQAEGIALLGQIAGRERVAADPDAARRIVTAAGLAPLGVRAVAERLAVLRHLPLSAYADRLATPSSLLAEIARADETAVRRLARTADELAAHARALLSCLGALPSPVFSLAEAAAAAGLGEEAAAAALETLLEEGAVAVPDAETMAHEVTYEIPVLLHALVAGRFTGSEPAAGRRPTGGS
jgi:DNA-binding SARP family transcriptional activator